MEINNNNNEKQTFKEIFLKNERSKSDHQRFLEFEHDLRYLFIRFNSDTTTIEDMVKLDNVKQSILTILMKEKFCNSTDDILLGNCWHFIRNELSDLQKKHNVFVDRILLFMEDYYLDEETENNG